MRAEEFVKNNLNNIVEDLCKFIELPSVYDPDNAEDSKPFGPGVAEGLEWTLKKAEKMGMKVKNVDGYAGEITVGDGPLMIGVLVHEDVVPAGDGWNTEPFKGVIEDGKIYGRGSSDDKGPLVSSLYAIKYLMDEKLIPEGVCIRMIVGTNEEELWECINYYVKKVDRLPDYSIVPDGYFPMIFCEKGLLDFNINIDAPCEEAELKVISIKGGSGRNVVPGKAEAVIEGDEASIKMLAEAAGRDFDVSVEGTRITITAEGKSTHAMQPELGVNAISRLMKFLGQSEKSFSIAGAIGKYNQAYGMTYNGENLGVAFEDELSGKLTFNMGVIEYAEDKLQIEANVRYPATLEKDFVVNAFIENGKAKGLDMEIYDYLPPVYIDPQSEFMKLLLSAYQEVTGDTETQSFAIGGATYARGIPNAVAYGALFPWETELAHEANEFLAIDSLEKMTLVYINALEKLVNMKR